MNYEETLDYLYNSAPLFQHIGKDAYKAGLENTYLLDKYFNHPHRQFRTIHIAGTNGKGSCSHTLAAILQSAGYKTGLYTSPHLIDFRERIRVNGIPVSKEYVIDFVEKHRAFFEPLHPTATVDNNIVTINADFYTPIDNVSIPTGEIAKVEGTPMDFRTPQRVDSRINDPFEQLEFGAGYDHCYVLNKREAGTLSFAAKCVEPESGRSMEVYTTEPGVQVYTSNWHNGFEGAHGATFPARSAICFEAQHFPDTPNKGHFPSCVLHPGETYNQVTIYKFGVEK